MKIAAFLSGSIVLFGSLNAENQFLAEADYLLFQAHQDGLFHATDLLMLSGNGDELRTTDYHVKDSTWNSGVRVKFGWEPECRPWNLSLQYTYMGNCISTPNIAKNYSAESIPVNHLLFTNYITNSTGIDAIYENKASWKFNFNQLDLLIEQPFCIGENSSLTPYFGLRGLQINQRLNLAFTNVFPLSHVDADVGSLSDNRVSFSPKVEGIGLIGGFTGRFELGYGFDLWGRVGGGLVWSRFKTSQDYRSVQASDQSVFLIESNDHQFCGTSLNADLALGIEWSCPFNDGCQWLVLSFAWENHLYTNTNHIQNFIFEEISFNSRNILTLDRNVQRGDFSFQGFSFGITYLF